MLHTKDHKYAQKLHAMRRVYQRYGILVDPPDYSRMCNDIISGKNQSIGPGRAGGTMHVVKHRGQDLVAVFDDKTQQVATFLPKGNKP